jgi:Protein of unknown function (DUF1592)/Protein of unknown function (DUF1588)/Protein of unknown function (DUF1595)/Protein of unknown function (DUF1585)/Protein of unknown function (DUF1587)
MAAFAAAAPACYLERDSEVVGPAPAAPQTSTNVAPLSCTEAQVQDSPIRRLTRWEYDNAAADLLGDNSGLGKRFLGESRQLGFTNGAASPPLSATVVEDYQAAALKLAESSVKNLNKHLGCDPSNGKEDACTDTFLTGFGRRAFRRPLSTEERTAYKAAIASWKTAYGYPKAIEMLTAAFLQSPDFLYRVEFGMPAPPQAPTTKVVKLNNYETASRLSFLFWGSIPDDALLDAAGKGELDTPAGVRKWAELLLKDERGRRAVTDFYVQWAKLEELPNLHKNTKDFTPAIAEAMLEETRTFVDETLRKGDGQFSSLLTSPTSYMSPALAQFYGLPIPSGAKTVGGLSRVDRDPSKHAGLLSQGALMSSQAHEAQASAVYRGKFVLEQLLCSPPPPPPCNANLQLPSPDPSKTRRQQLTELTGGKPCNGCHALLNPPGFAFENFDAVGRYQELDQNKRIDASGELLGVGDVRGSFTGVPSLAAVLAKSETVRTCAVTQWFHYAYGRGEGSADRCSVEQLKIAFQASKGNVPALLLELSQTPAFLYRTSIEGALSAKPTGGSP